MPYSIKLLSINKLKIMKHEKLFEVLKQSLELESTDISLSDKFRDYPEWDSLGQLSLIASLDEEFGVVIEGGEFSAIVTVGDLLAKIETLSQD